MVGHPSPLFVYMVWLVIDPWFWRFGWLKTILERRKSKLRIQIDSKKTDRKSWSFPCGTTGIQSSKSACAIRGWSTKANSFHANLVRVWGFNAEPSFCLSVFLSVGSSVCLSLSLSVRLSVGLSVCLSVGIFNCLSVCLSVCHPLKASPEAVVYFQPLTNPSILAAICGRFKPKERNDIVTIVHTSFW